LVGDLAPLLTSESDLFGAAELSGFLGIAFVLAPAAALPDVVPAVLPAAVVSLSDLVLDDLSMLRCFLSVLLLLLRAGFSSLVEAPLAALRSDFVLVLAPVFALPVAPALVLPDSDLAPVSALVLESGAWVVLWAAAS
jgi:hypothetical protein